jgi:hypothetical protein
MAHWLTSDEVIIVEWHHNGKKPEITLQSRKLENNSRISSNKNQLRVS